MQGVLCGTPTDYCTAGLKPVSASLRDARHFAGQVRKVHGSRIEAFRCYVHYLKDVLGYEQVGSREFTRPGEPILVLTKKIRFGGTLRGGKLGTRYMYKRRTGGAIF